MPVIEFNLLAGEISARTTVISRPNFPNAFPDALRDANIPVGDVDLIGGLRARVVALNGDDFGEYERIEIRACPRGSSGGCNNISSIVFSQEDLFRRRDQTVNLSPSLVNFRELLLGSDLYRFELTFRSGTVTSRNISGRLEWSLMAVGDLD